MSLPQPTQDRISHSQGLERFRGVLEDAFEAHESRLQETSELDDISMAIRRRSEDAQAEIQAALSRIEDGSFGICGGCSTEISLDRLEAMPQTRYCKGCAVRENRPNR